MQRFKFDIGGADAGAGDMSISSGSGGASDMGASSSSCDASAMAQSTTSSGAGSGSMCLEKSSSWAWSAAASSMPSLKWASLWARKRRQPVGHAWFLSQRSCTAQGAHTPTCLVHGQAFERAVKDGAGKRGARAALEAAEDGHVAGLQVRRASWREEAQHDVRESGPHGSQCGVAGVDARHVAEKDPRLSLPAWIEHAVQCGRALQDRGRRRPAVLRCDVASALRPGLFGQDGVCLAGVHDLHQHVQRATVHAEGDCVRRGLPRVALQLSFIDAAAAPPDLMHWQDAA